MESLSVPKNVLLISVIVLVGILANSLTHGRHLRKTLTQVDALDNFNAPAPAFGGDDKDDDDDEKIAKEEKEAKEISTSLSSLKLSKIPHRIYVAGMSWFHNKFLFYYFLRFFGKKVNQARYAINKVIIIKQKRKRTFWIAQYGIELYCT